MMGLEGGGRGQTMRGIVACGAAAVAEPVRP
jgi:hypothetical protein